MTIFIGYDASGNGNRWTANNFDQTESSPAYCNVTDTPTPYADGGNYAVLNPLNTTNGTLSQGNLQWVSSGGVGYLCTGTMAFNIADTSNKYYFEFTLASGDVLWGIAPTTLRGSDTGRAGSYGYYTNGNKYSGTSPSSYGASFTVGDIIGVAVGAGKITFYKNGVSQGDAFTGLTGYFVPMIAEVVGTYQANFGQRPFAYTPPTGFLPLHTGNLPDSSIVDGSKHFDVVTYTGDGTSSRSITGLEFQPDFSWLKSRSEARNHTLYDAVRGAGSNKALSSSTTDPEGLGTVAGASASFGYVSSLDSDGFSVSAGSTNAAYVNITAETYVAWNWKAGGTGVSNGAGSIESTVSANPTAGFSVVTWTAQSSGTATVGHGLGVAPNLVIVKSRTASPSGWNVYHSAVGATKVLYLNSTDAATTSSGNWNNTAPTSTVFTSGTGFVNGGNMVSYCFAEVEGYSKFGSYLGNSSSDGPFSHLNFRAKWLLIKKTTTGGGNPTENWYVWDSARETYNQMQATLSPNLSLDEASGNLIDIISNGFKIRTSWNGLNASGETYIYAAFAENPFKNSLAR